MSQIEGLTEMIYLYSPVPPLRTGTADYFKGIVSAIVAHQLPAEQIRIVIERAQYPEEIQTYNSIPVVDYAEVPNVATENELRFFFIANNTFHSYIHRALSELHVLPGANAIAVVHEPSCFMLHKHEAHAGTHSMSIDQLERNSRLQYQQKSRKFLDDLNAGHLPPLFDYVTLCARDYLIRATEIWTHSSFAASKLFLESNIPAASFPPIKVLRHPIYHYDFEGPVEDEVEVLARQKPGFRIGIFGWVSETKRVREAIAGLGLFLDRLIYKDQQTVDLIIVGQLPPPDVYDIQGLISQLDLQGFVKVFNFVDAPVFRALVRTCDLILNLRYPSCGESSGAMAHARGAHVLSMTTRYQAFAEEASVYSIVPLPGIESPLIAANIESAFSKWAAGSAQVDATQEQTAADGKEEPAGADTALAARCAIHLARVGVNQ